MQLPNIAEFSEVFLSPQNAIVFGIVFLVVTYFSVKYLAGGHPSKLLHDKKAWVEVPLIEKRIISHNTRIFKFGLKEGQCLGLPVGNHICFGAEINGDSIERQYTPVSSDDDKGFLECIIKVYPNGKMTQHLEKMKIGDNLRIRGPLGRFTYKKGMFKKVGMMAGGSGITPCLAIMREIVKHNDDQTEISLIFGNVTADDILLEKELADLHKQYPNRFKVLYHTLDHPPAGWVQGKGYITPSMIQANLPPPSSDTHIFVCGPPPMLKGCRANLVKLGYTRDQFFLF